MMLWGAGLCKLLGQTPAKFAGFGEDLLAGLFVQREHEFLVLKRAQVGHIALVENEDRRGRRTEQIQRPRAGFGIQFLAPDSEEIPLEQAIGEQNENDLIDDRLKSLDVNASRSEKHFSWRCRSSIVVRRA